MIYFPTLALIASMAVYVAVWKLTAERHHQEQMKKLERIEHHLVQITACIGTTWDRNLPVLYTKERVS